MGVANLVNISEVYGQTISGIVSDNTVATSFAHNISSGNETWVVKSLTLTNLSSNSTDNEFWCGFNSNPGFLAAIYICRYVWLPFKTTFIAFDESVPIYLQYGEQIEIGLHQGTNLHYVFKYERLRE